jgi:3-hydroxyacyl-CoA dehydrogenase / enoyl-CoA hydratase / 3-hydroxybutyryl-CoA epimerase
MESTQTAADAFRFELDGEGIATVTMDMPGRSANVINAEFGQALALTLKRIAEARDKGLKGVLLTSAKKTFMAGGDLEYLYSLTDPEDAFRMTEQLKAGFRALETCGVPVVAAINGAALGGGLELALSCHYRVALDDRSVKIGFPEVTLGLLPGAGGVVRSVRMLGLEASAPFLMQGKQIPASAALKAGFVNELAPDRDSLMAKARAWLLSGPEPTQPWDRKGFPHSGRRSPQPGYSSAHSGYAGPC